MVWLTDSARHDWAVKPQHDPTKEPKSTDTFLITPHKYMLWYSIEAPGGGTSNEYPQRMFS